MLNSKTAKTITNYSKNQAESFANYAKDKADSFKASEEGEYMMNKAKGLSNKGERIGKKASDKLSKLANKFNNIN